MLLETLLFVDDFLFFQRTTTTKKDQISENIFVFLSQKIRSRKITPM